jgi:hypothetical protein
LNSPFFITVVGGLGVGAITALYSHFKANHDKEMAEDKVRSEKQTAVLSSVANELPVYVSTMGSMMELKNWLADNKDDDAKFGSIGLPRNDVLKEYLEFYKLSLKTRTSVSILTEVRSFYGEMAVCSAVDKEESAIEAIGNAKHFDDVKAAGKAEEQAFDTLLGAMAQEAKKTHRNAPDKEVQPCTRQVVVHSPQN